MAKFVFALEGLKKYRAHKLLLAKKEMIVVENKLREAVTTYKKSVDSRSDFLDERNEKLSKGENMLLWSDLIQIETKRMAISSNAIDMLEKEMARHKDWVAHLGRELKAVEKYEEKKRDQFIKEESIKEKKIADSWVSERWAYNMTVENTAKEIVEKIA